MFNQKETNTQVRLESTKVRGIPVWFMRQAGRYLPEYQVSMSHIKNFFEACYNPELVVELTMQPIQRFDFDAAIIFSDIMVLLDCMGFNIEFIRGHGPVITEKHGVFLSHEDCLFKLSPVFNAIKMVRKTLAPHKALIGFAGAPWTLLSYIFGKEKNFAKLRIASLQKDPFLLQLLDELTELTSLYLILQVEHGADVLQLFDSGAYVLPPDLFSKFVLSPTKKIVQKVRAAHPNVQIIGFPKGCGVMYPLYASETGLDITSLDYSLPLSWIKDNISTPIQGNLDPFLLAYDIDKAVDQTLCILNQLGNRNLVFNLGHGILPETPLDNVQRILDVVKSYCFSS